eukprot:3440772-Pyramimonas_sp.AAC.1
MEKETSVVFSKRISKTGRLEGERSGPPVGLRRLGWVRIEILVRVGLSRGPGNSGIGTSSSPQDQSGRLAIGEAEFYRACDKVGFQPPKL